MKITIEIECDDYDEIMKHLSVIRSQIRKKREVIEVDSAFPDIVLQDSNCYGYHKITIQEE